jgi:hypothetical protein
VGIHINGVEPYSFSAMELVGVIICTLRESCCGINVTEIFWCHPEIFSSSCYLCSDGLISVVFCRLIVFL